MTTGPSKTGFGFKGRAEKFSEGLIPGPPESFGEPPFLLLPAGIIGLRLLFEGLRLVPDGVGLLDVFTQLCEAWKPFANWSDGLSMIRRQGPTVSGPRAGWRLRILRYVSAAPILFACSWKNY